ncbi:uncharacterized protein LOC143102878 [Alosa pseudoharengus]|uniref:uncharacterized protein LOC143102878 n=1 Tax=Alosa pseudoharengus TaxID=34774 RepID=UPI003F8CBF6E
MVLSLMAIEGSRSQTLTQSESALAKPGGSHKLTCTASGFNFGDYWMSWIRQEPGKGLDWVAAISFWAGSDIRYSTAVKGRFTISRDNNKKQVYLQMSSLKTEDTAVYYCARGGYGYFDYWGKGTQVTVSSGASSAPTSIFALSQCGSDSSGFVTLGCVVSGFLPADSQKFKWKDASGTDLTDFIQYPDIPKDGKYSKISQIRVQAADWEAKKDFTCEVDGKKAVITKPEEILQIPTLYLMKPTSEEIEQNNTATFACLATDFSPPVHTFKWKKEVGGEETVITGSYSFTSPANGNNSATSYLQIPGNVWINPGTKITCVFEHKSGNKARSVEYRFSDDDPCDDEKAVEVKIMPPSTEDLLVRKEGWVQCKITKQILGVQKDDLEWRKDGKAAVLDKKTDLKEDGSSITMKLKVTFEEWENGTEFSCFVPHDNIPSGIIKSYKRENGGPHIKPSVFLMPPPEHDESNDMTLTCYAKDFYPKEVFVSWLADDEPLDKSKQTDVINNDGEYSVYSQLTITQLQWQQGVVFSCVVYHESSDATVRMITRSIDITSQKPNVVSLSMNVPQCRSGYICIVWTDYQSMDGDGMANTAFTFIFLFLIMLFYSVGATVIKPIITCLTRICGDMILKSLISEEVLNPARLYVMIPSEVERFNKTSTFVCLAREFSPFEHTFHWKHNGVSIQEEGSCNQQGSKDNNSASSYLVISDERWAKGDKITCLFIHKAGNQSIEVPRQRTDQPNAVLQPPLWMGKDGGSKAQLLCAAEGVDMEDLDVEWVVDGKLQAAPKPLGQISQLEFDINLWNKGSNYTCRMKPKVLGSNWTEKSIQVCSDGHFLAPHVQLERPRLRDVTTTGKVVVTCKVTAASGSRVSWWVNDKQETSDINNKAESGGRLTSNLTLTVKSPQEVKCKVEHPCYPTEAAIIIMPEPAKQNPTVTIRRPLEDRQKDNGTVLECLLGDISSREVLVTLQANGKDLPKSEYVDIPIQKDQHSLTSVRFTIPEDQRSANKIFACKVIHDLAKNTKISNDTGNIFAPPTLELFLAPQFSSTTLVCVASGFNPQLKWNVTNLTANSKVSMEDNGRLTVTSKIIVPHREWYKGTTFPCEVEDHNQNHAKKKISICSVSPHMCAEVYIMGPPLNSTANSNVPLTCLVVGFNISDLPIVWRAGGVVTSEGVTGPIMSENDNGTQSVRSVLSLPASAWHGHTNISCEVRRACDPSALVRHISKAKDMRQPTVKIVRPSDAELVHTNGSGLLCVVTGFLPANVLVHWEVNGTQLPTSRYTNGPVSSSGEAGTYATSSSLPLPPSQERHKGSYTCVVRHESSTEPTSATVENLFASVELSKPTVTLLQGSSELVCLVFGYSPESINITWLKNGVSMEAADQRTTKPSKGPDGKFSVHSHLNLSSGDWDSRVKFTCNVTHITSSLSVSTSKPEPKEEVLFIDDNMADAVPEDTVAETMNMAWAFLFLFLFCLLYSCLVTLIKVK